MDLNLILPKITIESKCIRNHRPLCKKYGCRAPRMPDSYGCCSAHHVAVVEKTFKVINR